MMHEVLRLLDQLRIAAAAATTRKVTVQYTAAIMSRMALRTRIPTAVTWEWLSAEPPKPRRRRWASPLCLGSACTSRQSAHELARFG